MAGETRIVAGDGTGDYTADGSGDQVPINQALSYANTNGTAASPVTIELKGPFTFDLTDSMLAGSNTIFTGDPTAVVRVHNSANWAVWKPMLGNLVTVPENVEISGFTMDGNGFNQAAFASGDWGQGYVPGIYLKGTSASRMSNIKIHDMTIKNTLTDGARLDYGVGVHFYKNTTIQCMHEGVYFLRSSDCYCYDNDFTIRTNSGSRFYNVYNGWMYNNTYRPYALTSVAGNFGIQIEDNPDGLGYVAGNIEVYGNTLTNCWGGGIWAIDIRGTAGNKNLKIHDNTINGVGPITTTIYNSGITVQGWNGIELYNNVINGAYNAGVLVANAPSGGSGYVYYLDDNVITGIKDTLATQSQYKGAGHGYGMVNRQSAAVSIIATGNVVSGSVNGDYYQVTNNNDVPTKPIPRIIPALRIVDDEDLTTLYDPDFVSYINGYPICVVGYENDTDQSLSTDKPPGVNGWVLGDLGADGASIALRCFGIGKNDFRRAIAAWKQEGRAYLELGGYSPGYQVSGIVRSHSSGVSMDSGEYDVYNDDDAYPYKINFYCDDPFESTIHKHVRARTLTHSGEQWSADNSLAGNQLDNPSFETWTPDENGHATAIAGWTIYSDTFPSSRTQRVKVADGGYLKDSDGKYVNVSIPQSLVDISTEVAQDGLYSLMCTGDGVTSEIIYASQPVSFEAGVTYVVSGFGNLTYGQTGNIAADIYAGGESVVTIPFSYSEDGWVSGSAEVKFAIPPVDAILRVKGINTPGVLQMYVDKLGLQRLSDTDLFATGNDIATSGTVATVPDISIEAQGILAGSPGGGETVGNSTTWTDTANTGSTAFTSYQYQDFFNHTFAGKAGIKWRVDKVGLKQSLAASGATCWGKIEIYFGSTLAKTIEYSTTNYPADNWKIQSTNPAITGAVGESVTVKHYVKTTSASVRAYIRNVTATVTEITSTPTSSVTAGVSVFNISDPLTKMKLCNNIYPGIQISVNADGTGSLRHIENFSTSVYQSVVKSRSGDTYSSELKQVTLTGSLVWPYDSLSPVTGIPYIKLYVVSGTPKIQISLDNSTWYNVDGNTTAAKTAEWVTLELDNEANLRLYGKTSFYVKILPNSGTLVIGTYYMFSYLITIDAKHPVINATGAPETFEVEMTNDIPCTIKLRYQDKHWI